MCSGTKPQEYPETTFESNQLNESPSSNGFAEPNESEDPGRNNIPRQYSPSYYFDTDYLTLDALSRTEFTEQGHTLLSGLTLPKPFSNYDGSSAHFAFLEAESKKGRPVHATDRTFPLFEQTPEYGLIKNQLDIARRAEPKANLSSLDDALVNKFLEFHDNALNPKPAPALVAAAAPNQAQAADTSLNARAPNTPSEVSLSSLNSAVQPNGAAPPLSSQSAPGTEAVLLAEAKAPRNMREADAMLRENTPENVLKDKEWSDINAWKYTLAYFVEAQRENKVFNNQEYSQQVLKSFDLYKRQHPMGQNQLEKARETFQRAAHDMTELNDMSTEEKFAVFMAIHFGMYDYEKDVPLSYQQRYTKEEFEEKIITRIDYPFGDRVDIEVNDVSLSWPIPSEFVSPEYLNTHIRHVDKMVDSIANSPAMLAAFMADRSAWEGMSPEQRQTRLEDWVKLMTAEFGLPGHSMGKAEIIGIRAGVEKKDAMLEQIFGIGNGRFSISEDKVGLGPSILEKEWTDSAGDLNPNLSFEEALATVLHEVRHSYDFKLANSLFSIVNSEEMTEAEREHAMQFVMSIMRYDSGHRFGANTYAWQYSEYTSHYFENHLLQELSKIAPIK